MNEYESKVEIEKYTGQGQVEEITSQGVVKEVKDVKEIPIQFFYYIGANFGEESYTRLSGQYFV